MLYSPSAHTAGASGFHFPGDANAPADCFSVADSDVQTAINLPPGSSYSFTAPVAPAINGTISTVLPTAAFLLAQAQAAQIAILNASYQAAIVQPVSFTTAAGHTDTFAQDAQSKTYLMNAIDAGTKSGTWPLNLWLNAAGQPVTPFTYVDLQNLAAAMEAAEVPEYQDLLTKIAAVQAVATVAAVQAIVF